MISINDQDLSPNHNYGIEMGLIPKSINDQDLSPNHNPDWSVSLNAGSINDQDLSPNHNVRRRNQPERGV